ncbi:MAG: hypothetical protein DRJ50_06140, partial [Actinobacteria bacterium]
MRFEDCLEGNEYHNRTPVPVGGATTMTATLHTAPNFTETWVDARPAEPNYALRRTVVGLVAAFLVLAVAISSATAIGSLTGLGGRPAAASEAVPAVSGASSASFYVA